MKLLPEQIEDAARMANSADLPNFSKAGTGKTYTALEAFRLTGSSRAVVLCPKIALTMWGEEAEKMLGATAQVIRSSKTLISNADVVVTTYDIAASMKGAFIETFHGAKAVMINDESHAVNGVTAKRTKAVFGEKLDLAGGIAEQFEQVWNMSGTPMTGYADGMFTQAAILHQEIFGQYDAETYAKFEKMFTFKRQKQYHKSMQPVWKISGNQKEGFLNRLVYQELKAIRRLEAPGLPAARHRDLPVSIRLTADVRKALSGMTPEAIAGALSDPESMVAKVWHMVGLLKVTEALPYLGELAKQTPVLLGVWHRDVGAMYQEELIRMGLRCAQVNGSTSERDKDKTQKAFNEGFLDVLIGQMGAMGVSWNLQKASSNVVIAEEYPSATVIEQFFKRVYRYGQKNPVQIDYITSDTQIDTALRGVRERKAAGNELING